MLFVVQTDVQCRNSRILKHCQIHKPVPNLTPETTNSKQQRYFNHVPVRTEIGPEIQGTPQLFHTKLCKSRYTSPGQGLWRCPQGFAYQGHAFTSQGRALVPSIHWCFWWKWKDSKKSAYSSERQMKLSRIKFDHSDSGEVWWGYVIDNNHFQNSGFLLAMPFYLVPNSFLVATPILFLIP